MIILVSYYCWAQAVIAGFSLTKTHSVIDVKAVESSRYNPAAETEGSHLLFPSNLWHLQASKFSASAILTLVPPAGASVIAAVSVNVLPPTAGC